ncbi:MAG: fibronectin type III domain-containing protein [Bacteroidota bacterium]
MKPIVSLIKMYQLIGVLVSLLAYNMTSAQIDYGTPQLINSLTDQAILNISDGTTYDLNVVGDSLNIIAVPPGGASVESVNFLTTIGENNLENAGPYAFKKDNSGDFNSWLTLPNHLDTPITFTIQYWSANGAGGTLLGDDVFTVTFTKPAPDTSPPTAPTSLSSTGTTTATVSLSWTAATDNVAVTGYRVFQDGGAVATLGNVTNHTVSGLSANTSYQFTVRALDAAGNESTNSNAINVTTASAADTQAPSPPTVSSPSKTTTSVNLSWSGATDNVGVTGYRVFRDGSLEVTLGNVTNHTVSGLTADTSYLFTVRALDAAANESADSNALAVTTAADSGGGGSVWSENGAVASYSGNVAVGTATVPSGYNMAIDGKLITEEVRVELSDAWPDYVFTAGYPLPSLEEVAKHIQEKGHLINIPAAAEVEAEGLHLGEMNTLLLRKIEELMLYILQQEQRIRTLEKTLN